MIVIAVGGEDQPAAPGAERQPPLMHHKRDAEQGCHVAGAEHLSDKASIRQVFMPDVLPATLVALFVACSSCCILGAVGSWMPYHLSTEKHWSTQEYSAFYVCWGIVGFFGLWLAGWLANRIGRRVGFIAMLIQGATA